MFNKNKNYVSQKLVFLYVYNQIGNEDNLFYWNSRNKKIALLSVGKKHLNLLKRIKLTTKGTKNTKNK